jgi:hypothetical protein
MNWPPPLIQWFALSVLIIFFVASIFHLVCFLLVIRAWTEFKEPLPGVDVTIVQISPVMPNW